MRGWLASFLIVLGCFSIRAPAQADPARELRILRVTPAGDDVPDTRQIVVEFNRPVVPIGKMERTAAEVGISISPEPGCQWRWLNTSALSCNLDESKALATATKYTIVIQPRIAAEDGAKIAQTYRQAFTTLRPDISDTSFHDWRGPAHPVVRLTFNQPVTRRSVAAHLYMEPQAQAAKATVRYALNVSPDKDDQELPVYLPLPGEKIFLDLGAALRRKSDDKPTRKDGEEARRVWIVEPREELPGDAGIALMMEPGVIAAAGPEVNGPDKKEIVTFDTFPAIAFADIKCSDADGEDLILPASMPQKADRLCDPMRSVSLGFTAPVPRSQVRNHVLISPDLAGGRKDFNPWGEEDRDWSLLDQPHKKGRIYYIGLPVGLKAAKPYTVRIAGRDQPIVQRMKDYFAHRQDFLTDEFGRPLPQSITMDFATGHRNPNYELPYHDAVMESAIDSELPVYVNNLKSITLNYRSVTASGAQAGRTETQTIPPVRDLQFAVPGNIRKMLKGGSGALYGVLSSDPDVPRAENQKGRLFAEVTPYQVHFKLGHFQSLAWVTSLSTGQPVAEAKVTIYADSLAALSAPSAILATAETDGDGIARLPGAATLDPDQKLAHGWEDTENHLFVRVDKGSDMALLPASGTFAINTWQASDDGIDTMNVDRNGHMEAWGMTAQGVYHAGDTMQYKIYVRGQDNLTLIPPPAAAYRLDIIDPAGKLAARIKDIKLSSFGTYNGEYAIPKAAAVGWYQFRLTADFTGKPEKEAAPPDDENGGDEDGETDNETSDGVVKLRPMRVLVSDFTPSPFSVRTEISGDRFQANDKMPVSVAAKLHSGGAYTDASARVTVTLNSRLFTSDDPAAKNYSFDSFPDEHDSEQIEQKSAPLDGKGEWRDSIPLPAQKIVYGALEVEGAVQDDRGKSVASLAHADYFGVDRLVGLKSTQWVYQKGKAVSIPVIVVDDHGKPVPGVSAAVAVEQEVVNTVKIKGAGNAYLADTTTDWKKTSSCALVSAAEGVACTFTPAAAGTYRLTASIRDSRGTAHQTRISLWVTGDDYVQWDEHSETILPIMPEKKEYHVGDTARYLIKNPYPGAKALITIERYGVLDSFVRTLNGSTPVVEFPVKPDYLPGFYLSVLVVSPRVEKPLGAGQVDLGKPAFRIGYVPVPVRDPYKEMQVDVHVARDVYRPRDTISLDLSAKPRFAPATPQPVELAVAVLDESVFDLVAGGRDAFDPYKGFYSMGPLDLRNYSLLTRLIGRQKFEKKGANPGGDGGRDVNMRNIFKYVSYWNPSVPVDADGRAHIDFTAPDNLTGWRVLALAATPGDRMGLGQGSFKVNQPTEIRPVMPNQLREGDTFEAGFSVMNRTDKTRTLHVTITASGDLKGGKQQSKTQDVTLGAYKREIVFLPLESALLPADREIQEGKISFTAKAYDRQDGDGMNFTLPVGKSRFFDVAANYATVTEARTREHIAFPTDIHTDSGDVSVVLSPSVIANLTGAFRYMRDYPYLCWEQILTKGVMAAQYQKLKAYLPPSLTWPESDKLAQATLDQAGSFQAPGGGMAYFIAQDQYADPYLSAYTAEAFNWLRRDGYKIPAEMENKLDAYLFNFLRQDAAPDFYQPGMISTVRAVALAALAENGKVTKDDLLRYRPYLKGMTLFGKAHYLQAAVRLNAAPDILREPADMILATGSETGGKFSFNETYDDGYARILATPLRDNCAVLDSFLGYGASDAGKELIGDKPFKLVRAITQSRGSRDYWENTQENMYCMNALADYAHAYENVTPDMKVTVALDAKPFGSAAFTSFTDAPATISRAIQANDPGRTADLDIGKAGQGRLYYAARLRYAPKAGADRAVNAGMDIHREYSIKRNGKWVLLKDPVSLKRGDLVRIDLFLSVPTARNFVAVNDPVPGGLEPVNRDLATASAVDADAGAYDGAGGSFWFKYNDWTEYNISRWSFYHQELRQDSARFFADWLPAGNYHLSYTAQAVAEGHFAIPGVRAEEMYDPDIYARGIAGSLDVKAAE